MEEEEEEEEDSDDEPIEYKGKGDVCNFFERINKLVKGGIPSRFCVRFNFNKKKEEGKLVFDIQKNFIGELKKVKGILKNELPSFLNYIGVKKLIISGNIGHERLLEDIISSCICYSINKFQISETFHYEYTRAGANRLRFTIQHKSFIDLDRVEIHVDGTNQGVSRCVLSLLGSLSSTIDEGKICIYLNEFSTLSHISRLIANHDLYENSWANGIQGLDALYSVKICPSATPIEQLEYLVVFLQSAICEYVKFSVHTFYPENELSIINALNLKEHHNFSLDIKYNYVNNNAFINLLKSKRAPSRLKLCIYDAQEAGVLETHKIISKLNLESFTFFYDVVLDKYYREVVFARTDSGKFKGQYFLPKQVIVEGTNDVQGECISLENFIRMNIKEMRKELEFVLGLTCINKDELNPINNYAKLPPKIHELVLKGLFVSTEE